MNTKYIALVNSETRAIEYAESYDDEEEFNMRHRSLVVESEMRNGMRGPWRVPVGDTPFSWEEEDAAAAKEKIQARIGEIKADLSRLDLDSIRALRAVALGHFSKEDADVLTAAEKAAVLLRDELKGLEV